MQSGTRGEAVNEIPEVFCAVVQFALARGVKAIKDSPGCWESAIGERWWVAVNPHRETVKCSHDVEVPFGEMYFEFNGCGATQERALCLAAARMTGYVEA